MVSALPFAGRNALLPVDLPGREEIPGTVSLVERAAAGRGNDETSALEGKIRKRGARRISKPDWSQASSLETRVTPERRVWLRTVSSRSSAGRYVRGVSSPIGMTFFQRQASPKLMCVIRSQSHMNDSNPKLANRLSY